MADIALNWLRREVVMNRGVNTITTLTTVPIIGKDPMRFMLSIMADATGKTFLGTNTVSDTQFFHQFTPDSPNITLSEDEWGDFITGSFFVLPTVSGTTIWTTSLSYCPCKWSKYESIYKSVLRQ